MAYCSEAEIRLRAPAMPGDATGDSQVGEAIEAAEAEIDARLSGRYPVPFNPVPRLINAIAIDLAAAWALSAAFSAEGVDDQVKYAEYLEKRARELLEMLVKGELVLADAGDPVAASVPPLGISTFGQTPKIAGFDPYGKLPFPELPGR